MEGGGGGGGGRFQAIGELWVSFHWLVQGPCGLLESTGEHHGRSRLKMTITACVSFPSAGNAGVFVEICSRYKRF